jgi:hypothetical protein
MPGSAARSADHCGGAGARRWRNCSDGLHVGARGPARILIHDDRAALRGRRPDSDARRQQDRAATTANLVRHHTNLLQPPERSYFAGFVISDTYKSQNAARSMSNRTFTFCVPAGNSSGFARARRRDSAYPIDRP